MDSNHWQPAEFERSEYPLERENEFISTLNGETATALAADTNYMISWLLNRVSDTYEKGLPMIEANMANSNCYRPDLLINRQPRYLRVRIRFLLDQFDINYACTAAQGHFTDQLISNDDVCPLVGLSWSICNDELDQLPLTVWGSKTFTQYRRLTPRFMKFLLQSHQYGKLTTCQLTDDENEFVQGYRFTCSDWPKHEWMPSGMWQYYYHEAQARRTIPYTITKRKLKMLMCAYQPDPRIAEFGRRLTSMDYFKVLDGTTEPTM